MPSFQIITSQNDIQLSDEWKNSKKFASSGRIVNQEGNAYDDFEKAPPAYRLIDKRERMFSIQERIGRAVFGIFLTVSTFGKELFRTNYVKNLFFKTKETVRYGTLFHSTPTGRQPGYSQTGET